MYAEDRTENTITPSQETYPWCSQLHTRCTPKTGQRTQSLPLRRHTPGGVNSTKGVRRRQDREHNHSLSGDIPLVESTPHKVYAKDRTENTITPSQETYPWWSQLHTMCTPKTGQRTQSLPLRKHTPGGVNSTQGVRRRQDREHNHSLSGDIPLVESTLHKVYAEDRTENTITPSQETYPWCSQLHTRCTPKTGQRTQSLPFRRHTPGGVNSTQGVRRRQDREHNHSLSGDIPLVESTPHKVYAEDRTENTITPSQETYPWWSQLHTMCTPKTGQRTQSLPLRRHTPGGVNSTQGVRQRQDREHNHSLSGDIPLVESTPHKVYTEDRTENTITPSQETYPWWSQLHTRCTLKTGQRTQSLPRRRHTPGGVNSTQGVRRRQDREHNHSLSGDITLVESTRHKVYAEDRIENTITPSQETYPWWSQLYTRCTPNIGQRTQSLPLRRHTSGGVNSTQGVCRRQDREHNHSLSGDIPLVESTPHKVYAEDRTENTITPSQETYPWWSQLYTRCTPKTG